MGEIENRGPALRAVSCTLLAFSVVAVALRVYVRIGLVKNFGIDDYFMVAALVSFILFVTCAVTGVEYGTGRHFTDLLPENAQTAMMYWWFCYIWYCWSMILSKISIGYFLLRVTIHKLHLWIIYGVMAVTVLTGIVFFFVTLLQCNPLPFFWTKITNPKGGTCIPIEIIKALTYLYSACSIICDFTFAILPGFMIWNLNMNKATKMALIPIMGMACIASSAVVVRLAYIEDFSNPDFLYATVDIAIWSTTEQGLAITAGSLACLRPLFRKLSAHMGWSMSGMRPSGMDYQRSADNRNNSSHLKSNDKANRIKHGQYSLSDFTRHEDEPDLEAANKGTTTTYISSGKRSSSVWGQQGKRTNESQEELHSKGSNEGIGGVATLKSFLVTEERM